MSHVMPMILVAPRIGKKLSKSFSTFLKEEKICYKMVIKLFVFKLSQSSGIALESYADEKATFLKRGLSLKGLKV